MKYQPSVYQEIKILQHCKGFVKQKNLNLIKSLGLYFHGSLHQCRAVEAVALIVFVLLILVCRSSFPQLKWGLGLTDIGQSVTVIQ